VTVVVWTGTLQARAAQAQADDALRDQDRAARHALVARLHAEGGVAWLREELAEEARDPDAQPPLESPQLRLLSKTFYEAGDVVEVVFEVQEDGDYLVTSTGMVAGPSQGWRDDPVQIHAEHVVRAVLSSDGARCEVISAADGEPREAPRAAVLGPGR
jgi:hypothetical protein